MCMSEEFNEHFDTIIDEFKLKFDKPYYATVFPRFMSI